MAVVYFEYDGNKYNIVKNQVYDEGFLLVQGELASNILSAYNQTIDYTKFTEVERVNFIKELKDAGQYTYCIKVGLYEMEHVIDQDCVFSVAPIITSCYRAISKPQAAIDFYNQYRNVPGCFKNGALFTSVGAAYADLEDYDNAYKFANIACAIHRSNNNDPPELIGLYSRLKKETGKY